MIGPLLINRLRQSQIDAGVPAADAYNKTMYVLAGLLVIGLICNLFVKPVADRHFMVEDESPALLAGNPEGGTGGAS